MDIERTGADQVSRPSCYSVTTCDMVTRMILPTLPTMILPTLVGQKWPTNLCCMTERPRVFAFCFKTSVCELLGDEYLISWLLSARMHLSGTAMDITISPFSHTWLTYCPLRLPAHPPPTHPVDGRNVTLKKTIFKNHTQAPGGLAPPKTCQTTAKTLWKIGLQNQTVRRVCIYVSTAVLA